VSGEPREVEGVLVVSAPDPEAVARRLAALETVDRFDLVARPVLRLRDVSLDTADGALGAARVTLRLREQDGRPLLTLKADAVRSGLAAERLELEAPWSAEALQAALDELARRGVGVPAAGPGAGAPLEVLAGLGLHPTQTRDTTRTPRDVLERSRPAAGPVAELVVDDVGYRFPAGAVRLLEVEVEAKGPGGLATVQALLAALAEGFPGELRPWPWGKLATGRAAERLLAAGALEGLLGPAGRLGPAAYDRLAEILQQNNP
jgi:inorganic triphosphatase YgiF